MSTPDYGIVHRLNWGHFWDKYAIDYTRLLALATVEGDGVCFTHTGFPLCRYEPHVAYRVAIRLGFNTRDVKLPDYLFYPRFRITGKERDFSEEHNFYAAEHGNASKLWEEVVMQSCSWGWGQTLGESWSGATKRPATMLRKMAQSISGQIKMFEDECVSSGVFNQLAAGNWDKVARLYNGSGMVASYSKKLQSAQKLWATRGRPDYDPALPDAPANVHC